jgi:hypothetical protein
MRSLRFLFPALLLCLCGCLDIPYKATRVSADEKIYAVNFSESEANQILERIGITNRYVYKIERDSRGSALFAYFVGIGNETRSALIVSERGCVVTNFSGVTDSMGLRDDLTVAYSLQGDHYVFADGQSLPKRGKTEKSCLSVVGAPGNEVLALRYSDEPDCVVVHSSDPQKPLFHLDANKDIPVQRIFYQDNAIFVFGAIYDAKGKAHWECWTYRKNAGTWQRESRIKIPDAQEVLDLDPESSDVLCYRWGLMHKTAFMFNLGTEETSKVGLTIWRDHGYFLREGVVMRINSAVKSH